MRTPAVGQTPTPTGVPRPDNGAAKPHGQAGAFQRKVSTRIIMCARLRSVSGCKQPSFLEEDTKILRDVVRSGLRK